MNVDYMIDILIIVIFLVITKAPPMAELL